MTDNPTPLIALSVLELDLDPPGGGWDLDLARRGVSVVIDDLGRRSISRDAARRLFTERRESQVRAQEAAARNDVELEARRLASIRPGIPAGMIPDGVLPVVAMTAADRDNRPRRLTPLQEALNNTGELAFHPLRDEADDWVVGGGDG